MPSSLLSIWCSKLVRGGIEGVSAVKHAILSCARAAGCRRGVILEARNGSTCSEDAWLVLSPDEDVLNTDNRRNQVHWQRGSVLRWTGRVSEFHGDGDVNVNGGDWRE